MPVISSINPRVINNEPPIKLIKTPVFVYAGRVENEKQRHFQQHKHDQITEIIYIASGEAIFNIGGTEYKTKAGNLLVVNSGVPHEEFYWSEGDIEIYYCSINNLHVSGLKEQCLIPDAASPILESGDTQPLIHTLFNTLFEESCARRSGYDVICNNLVLMLTILTLRISMRDQMEANFPAAFPERIREYIDTNFTQNITLKRLAQEFHITPSYLSHTFKKHYGVPPIRYQATKRIDEAMRLLSCTKLKVNVISSTVGYTNTNKFFEAFKQYTGVTPSKYRQLLKENVVYFNSDGFITSGPAEAKS